MTPAGPPLPPGLRVLNAGNAGPFTLDGTRTYIVGDRRGAIVDPGPDEPGHLRKLARAVETCEHVHVLLTHGHRDHAGGLERLLDALDEAGTPYTVFGAGHARAEALSDGEEVSTDAGRIEAMATPGHTRDHLAFRWIRREAGPAVFPGDAVMGRGDTTWVAEYPGCVADYLSTLRRLMEADAALLLPAHGPPIDDPARALARYEEHRRERIEQVRDALRRISPAEGPAERGVDAAGEPPEDLPPHPREDELYRAVYGDSVPRGLEAAARRSLRALVEHVQSGPETPA